MGQNILRILFTISGISFALESNAGSQENVVFKSDKIAIYDSGNGKKIDTKSKEEFPSTAEQLEKNEGTGRIKLNFGPPIGAIWVLERHVSFGSQKREIACDTIASANTINAPRAAGEAIPCKKK